jgi:hypothetical protein
MSPNETDPAGSRDGFVCEVCDRRFESDAALRRHIRDVGLVR